MLTAMLSAVEAFALALAWAPAPEWVKTAPRGLIGTPLLHTADGAGWGTTVQHRTALPETRGRGHAGHAQADGP